MGVLFDNRKIRPKKAEDKVKKESPMPEEADDRGGRGGGRGRRDGRDGAREDSPFEVAFALVIERLMRAFGQQAATFIPADVLNEAKRLAGQKQLGPAVRTLGKIASIFGDDEEIRAVITGLSGGIADRIDRIPGTGDVASQTRQILDDPDDPNVAGRLKRLVELQKAGRLEEQRTLPLEEALTYLTQAQREVVTRVFLKLDPKIEVFKTRFTPRGLQGIAQLIVDAGGPTDEVVQRVTARLTPPKAGVDKQLATVDKVAKALGGLLQPKPGHVGPTLEDRAKGLSKTLRGNVTPLSILNKK